MTGARKAKLIKTSLQLDEELLRDIDDAAHGRGEKRPVIAREWLRLGREEARRRQRMLGDSDQASEKQTAAV